MAATTQENLIIIRIMYEMRTLPEELLGHFEGLHKALCITRKLRPAFSKHFYGIFNKIDENDLELIPTPPLHEA
jgi:hypothetical protein